MTLLHWTASGSVGFLKAAATRRVVSSPQGRGGERRVTDAARRRHAEELQEEVGSEGVVSDQEAAVSVEPVQNSGARQSVICQNRSWMKLFYRFSGMKKLKSLGFQFRKWDQMFDRTFGLREVLMFLLPGISWRSRGSWALMKTRRTSLSRPGRSCRAAARRRRMMKRLGWKAMKRRWRRRAAPHPQRLLEPPVWSRGRLRGRWVSPRRRRQAPERKRLTCSSVPSPQTTPGTPRTPRRATPSIPSRSQPARRPANVLEEARTRWEPEPQVACLFGALTAVRFHQGLTVS